MLLFCSGGSLNGFTSKHKRDLQVKLVSGEMLRAQYAGLYYLVPGLAAVTPLALVVEMLWSDGALSGWSANLHKTAHAY